LTNYNMTPFLKIGHRGACGYEPENTLRSFKKALALGVDMIELDIWLTKDNRIVVIHDITVNRTTNGKGRVDELTLEEIKKLDAGQGEAVPLLSEVMDLVKGRAQLNIEIKTKDVAERLIVELKQSNFPLADLLISSNYLETIQYFKDQMPELKVAWVFKAIENPPFYLKVIKWIFFILVFIRKIFPFLKLDWLYRSLTFPIGQLIWGMLMTGILPLTNFLIIEKLLNKKIDTICIYYFIVNKILIKRIHKYNKKIIVWTVNQPRLIKKLKHWGVDGIFCNYPDRL